MIFGEVFRIDVHLFGIPPMLAPGPTGAIARRWSAVRNSLPRGGQETVEDVAITTPPTLSGEPPTEVTARIEPEASRIAPLDTGANPFSGKAPTPQPDADGMIDLGLEAEDPKALFIDDGPSAKPDFGPEPGGPASGPTADRESEAE